MEKKKQEPASEKHADFDRKVEQSDPEWQRTGGKENQSAGNAQETSGRPSSKKHPQPRDEDPADFDRDVESNDPEWQRAGGRS